MGTLNTREVAVSWERENRVTDGRRGGYTGDVKCDRLLPKDLKQTQQNVKILLSWYLGVHCINVVYFYVYLKYLLKSNMV